MSEHSSPQHAEGDHSGRIVPIAMLVGIVLLLVGLAVVGAIIFPVFARKREKARAVTCFVNVKQVALAFCMYATDHGDHLPPQSGWETALQGGYCPDPYVLFCVERENWRSWRSHRGPVTASPDFEMNLLLSQRKPDTLGVPCETVLIYEVEGGRLVRPHRKREGWRMGSNFGFADGHSKWSADLPPGFNPPEARLGYE